MNTYELISLKAGDSLRLRLSYRASVLTKFAIEGSIELMQRAAPWVLKELVSEQRLLAYAEAQKTAWRLTELKAKVEFAVFWEAYGLKRDKKVAQDLWLKLSPACQQKAIDVIPKYKNELKLSGEFQKHPKTYLRQRKWEDYY